MNSLAPLLDRLESAATEIAATRQRVSMGEPWPVGAAASGDGEGAWGPTEVLAHVAEMLPYWLGEIERVVAGTGDPVPFGRTGADQIRALTVERDATLPARELYDRIASAVDRYRRRLPQLSESEVGRRGLHPVRGALAVPDILKRMAVTHLEDHAAQLSRALA